jgi:tetratricopeptide (TPR) repeat protein
LDESGHHTSPAELSFLDHLRIVRRQTTRLAILIGITIAAFALTRWMAGIMRDLHRADAAQWQQLGQERLAGGDIAGGITALRRAGAMNEEDGRVQLELAGAYLVAGEYDAARDVLLGVRARHPDDAEVSLRLATLEAQTGRTEEAIRHYQATLLALWGPEQLDRRRDLRVRYIEFLLARDEHARALSETLLLAGEITDEATSHLRVGELFLQAGDAARALAQFEAALALAPRDGHTFARAGDAAFQSGNFRLAARYLARADDDARTRELQPLVETIVALDPLLPGLSMAERQRRVVTAAGRLAGELDACRTDRCGKGEPQCATVEALVAELESTRASLRRRRASDESVDAGLSTVTSLSERVVSACGAGGIVTRALELIAAHHGVVP